MMAQPMQMAISGLAIMCGLVAFGFYAKQGCDPHSAGYISSFNQVCLSLYHMCVTVILKNLDVG